MNHGGSFLPNDSVEGFRHFCVACAGLSYDEVEEDYVGYDDCEDPQYPEEPGFGFWEAESWTDERLVADTESKHGEELTEEHAEVLVLRRNEGVRGARSSSCACFTTSE